MVSLQIGSTARATSYKPESIRAPSLFRGATDEPSLMADRYIGIDDREGRQVWADVASSVVQWVSVAEHDELIAIGYIDLDGLILVETESELDG